MIKDFIKGEEKQHIEYELEFTDNKGNGFAFPCNRLGEVSELTPEGKNNYEWCLEHRGQFDVSGVVKRISWWYKEQNSGICKCGNRIELFDQYMGACECPHCGQWWNLFGQELRDPSEWEMISYDDEYGEIW